MKIQIDSNIFSRVIPIIKIEERNSNGTKNEKLDGLHSDRSITNELSDTSKSSEVIFLNKLKVRMLIYNFQMGGKSEGNKKVINVPVKIEIKDNNLVSESPKKTEKKVFFCQKKRKTID